MYGLKIHVLNIGEVFSYFWIKIKGIKALTFSSHPLDCLLQYPGDGPTLEREQFSRYPKMMTALFLQNGVWPWNSTHSTLSVTTVLSVSIQSEARVLSLVHTNLILLQKQNRQFTCLSHIH